MRTPIALELGYLFKELREQLQIPIKSLADAASLSLPTLSNLEEGRTRTTIDTLERVAGVMRVPLGLMVCASETRVDPYFPVRISMDELLASRKPGMKL